MTPDRFEYRPGFGVRTRLSRGDWLLVAQHNYQLDMLTAGDGIEHAFRQVLYADRPLSENWIGGVFDGWLYRWREAFSGVEFFRAGATLSRTLDEDLSVSVGYFFGWANAGGSWTTDGYTFLVGGLKDPLWIHVF